MTVAWDKVGAVALVVAFLVAIAVFVHPIAAAILVAFFLAVSLFCVSSFSAIDNLVLYQNHEPMSPWRWINPFWYVMRFIAWPFLKPEGWAEATPKPDSESPYR